MKQIALPLDEIRPGIVSSLIISSANVEAVEALASSHTWLSHCAILCGPARSGKTLMAEYFSGISSAGFVIDNAECVGEEALFNAWNRAQELKQSLLLVSRFQLSDWQIALPDLRSRLASAILLQVLPPDDELISQLIQKHLADRGTVIGMDTLAYVTKRIERSYAALEKFARDVNAAAMEQNCAVNMSMVKLFLK